VCVLLCQQAAEKMLKAAYVATKGKEAPFTQNLAMLLRELGGCAELIGDSAELTSDYIGTRYPAGDDVIPAERFCEATSSDRRERAQAIIDWAEGVLDEALADNSN
jgi:HEPN domain-containing protein